MANWQKVKTLVSIKWQQPEDGESGVAKATGRATHMAVLQKTILVKMVEEPRIRMKWVREKKAQLPGWQPRLQCKHVSHTGTRAQRSVHREPEACVTFGHMVTGQRGADGDRTGQYQNSYLDLVV